MQCIFFYGFSIMMASSNNVALKSIDELLSSATEDPMIQSASAVNHLTRNPISATSVADFDLEKDQKPELELDEPEPCKNVAPISPFADRFTNMASAMAGAKILFATDDWFAVAESLLQDGPPIFDPDAFCEQGKVLDGWETRRRRQAGHDWCLIQLSKRASVHAIELDTAHFTGNNVPNISVEVCDVGASDLSQMVSKIPGAFERLLHGGVQGKGCLPQEVADASEAVSGAEWKELLPTTPLSPGFEATRMHRFHLCSTSTSDATTARTPITGNLIRINYFPDGGVARFRCWGNSLGDVKPVTTPLYMPIQTCKACTVVAHSSVRDESELPSRRLDENDGDELYSELSSLDQGGIGGTCSNKHYGEPWRLIQTTLGKDMGDGWETARHPNRPGILMMSSSKQCGTSGSASASATSGLLDTRLSDWAVLKLGRATPSGVARIILDTKHFRGNFPESVSVEGCYDPTEDAVDDDDDDEQQPQWFSLIPRSKLSPDAEHAFERSKGQVENADKIVTHVRVSIFPDGGISRVRIYG
jgi:allantoicase